MATAWTELLRSGKWRAGAWVQVLSPDEILATLDSNGCLDALPFMPEMLPHCGKRFQIVKTAHKTCDPTGVGNLRRMKDAVHLQTRCSGNAHGGCQAECLLTWKTAWLKPVSGPASSDSQTTSAPSSHSSAPPSNDQHSTPVCTLETLQSKTKVSGDNGNAVYRCQVTEIVRATMPLSSAAPSQFLQDLLSRNISIGQFLVFLPLAVVKTTKAALQETLNRLGKHSPASAADSTPAASNPTPAPKSPRLNLQPGELVQIRSKGEIMSTLNKDRKNLGLSFDSDMAQNCGTTHRVRTRVERVIDEKTGKLVKISRDCLILEDVSCKGLDCRQRLFCARGSYMFWREAWLKRVEEKQISPSPQTAITDSKHEMAGQAPQ